MFPRGEADMKSILLGVFLLGATAGLAGAAPLLAPTEVDGTRILPPPPLAGSPLAQAEVAELHAIHARTTPEMLAAATKDANDEKPDLFNNVLGFDAMALPATAKLLSEVTEEQGSDSGRAKTFFHRDRPWIVDASDVTCTMVLPGPAANSYPSGHSTLAWSNAVVLAALMPEKSQIILARARDYAENRLVCGMHCRSDIAAGQQLGTAVAIKLMANPVFQAQMETARNELRAAHQIN
jgi:acid phosphatase (class A)